MRIPKCCAVKRFCNSHSEVLKCAIGTTPMGFEPTRAEPKGLAGLRLNHSATVSDDNIGTDEPASTEFVLRRRDSCEKAVGSLATRCCGAAAVTTQARCPSTVPSGRFSLLCFQPEALLASLAARTSRVTRRCPCGLGTWRGRAINAACAASRNWFTIHQSSPRLGNSAALLGPAVLVCRWLVFRSEKAQQPNGFAKPGRDCRGREVFDPSREKCFRAALIRWRYRSHGVCLPAGVVASLSSGGLSFCARRVLDRVT